MITLEDKPIIDKKEKAKLDIAILRLRRDNCPKKICHIHGNCNYFINLTLSDNCFPTTKLDYRLEVCNKFPQVCEAYKED